MLAKMVAFLAEPVPVRVRPVCRGVRAAGLRSHPGVAASFFACIGKAGVNIDMISTSEIRVSIVCRDTDLDTAVRAIHDQFELGGNEEADGRPRTTRFRKALDEPPSPFTVIM